MLHIFRNKLIKLIDEILVLLVVNNYNQANIELTNLIEEIKKLFKR
jgi:hypothetical protein